MDHRAIIHALKPVYFAKLDEVRRTDEVNGTNYAAHFIGFYDFLLRQGYKRRQLAALGITRKWAEVRE